MRKLGTSGHPAIVRVQTQARAAEIISLCELHDWKVIVGVEPNKEEDISDVNRLANPPEPIRSTATVGRNNLCPCGSGRKYKKCCGV